MGLFEKRAHVAVWQRVASDLGGTYQPAKGLLQTTPERIEVRVDDVPITVESYNVVKSQMRVLGPTQTERSYTRVSAPYQRGPGPRLRVFEHGSATATADIRGIADHSIDDPGFEARFGIRSDNPAVTRRLLGLEIKQRIAGFAHATLRGDAARVELAQPLIWHTAPMLHDGIELMRLLATRDLYGVDVLARVRDAVIERVDGRPQAAMMTRTRVVLRAEAKGNQLVMVARSADRLLVPPGVIEITGGKVVGLDVLPHAAHAALAGVGTATLTIDDGMTLMWPALDIDPEALRAGADLLGALANADTHAYR